MDDRDGNRDNTHEPVINFWEGGGEGMERKLISIVGEANALD